jgi:hypothetical protein
MFQDLGSARAYSSLFGGVCVDWQKYLRRNIQQLRRMRHRRAVVSCA